MEADPHFVELGAAVNLLRGPLVVPPRKPLVTFAAGTSADDAPWSAPALSLHDDVDDLIDAIFDVCVLPFQGDPPPFRVPVSALMLTDARDEAIAALSRRLGVDLTAPAGGYMLLKMRRETGDFMHEGVRGGVGQRIQIKNYWTPEGRLAMGRLRTGKRIVEGAKRDAVVTERQAQRYLDYCYDFGTHFVTRVIVGVQLLQVFACSPARYAQVKTMLVQEARGSIVTGPLVYGFRFLTRPDWTFARGRIISVGGDHDLTEAGSLLDPFKPEVFSHFRTTAPITIGLTCQSQFMETFRSGVFARVVKGALLQKYGHRIRLPVVRAQMIRVPEEFAFPATARRAGDGSLSAFSVALELGEPRSLDASRVSLCSYRAVFGSGGCGVSTLTLSGETLDDFQFVAEEVEGGLFVTNGGATRRETLYGGLRFATDSSGAVALRGDIRTPAAELSRLALEDARGTLDYAEALILGGGAEEVRFARRYLEWLEAMARGYECGEALRRRILYLMRLEGDAPLSPIGIDVAEILDAVPRLTVQSNDLARRILSGDATVTPLLDAASDALRETTDRIDAVLQVDSESPPAGQTARERFFTAKWRLIKAVARLSSAQRSPRPPR